MTTPQEFDIVTENGITVRATVTVDDCVNVTLLASFLNRAELRMFDLMSLSGLPSDFKCYWDDESSQSRYTIGWKFSLEFEKIFTTQKLLTMMLNRGRLLA